MSNEQRENLVQRLAEAACTAIGDGDNIFNDKDLHDIIADAIRAHLPAGEEAVAWLIEHHSGNCDWYLAAHHRRGGYGFHWEHGADKAIRFARQEDAAAVLEVAKGHVGQGSAAVVREHIFYTHPAPSVSAQPSDEFRNMLDIIVNNAEVQPDARMNGSTDCYAVPLDDIEKARAMLSGAAPSVSAWVPNAVALAYGLLWHVNAGMDAPADVRQPSLTPEKAAYEARKVLRDLMTKDQRGDGINAARVMLTAPTASGEGEGK